MTHAIISRCNIKRPCIIPHTSYIYVSYDACNKWALFFKKQKQSHYGPWGFQEVKPPRFKDNRNLKVVRLSTLRTGRLYPFRKYSWYSFLLGTESNPGPWWGRKDYVNENSSDTIGNRTRDLPACSAVTQPTAPLRAPLFFKGLIKCLTRTKI